MKNCLVQKVTEIDLNGLAPHVQAGVRKEMEQSARRLPFIQRFEDLKATAVPPLGCS